jgi:hypothetical protein
VDVIVSVPKERLGEFYSMLATFFRTLPSVKRERGSASAVDVDEYVEGVDEPLRGRYAPFYEDLVTIEGDALHMTFGQIEQVLGGKLSPSARKPRPAWGNSMSSLLGRVSLAAGWRLAWIDMEVEHVRFKRDIGA